MQLFLRKLDFFVALSPRHSEHNLVFFWRGIHRIVVFVSQDLLTNPTAISMKRKKRAVAGGFDAKDVGL